MRAMLIGLLVMGACGCGSDDAATPEQPASTPTASKPVDDPKPAAKTPDVVTPLPDVATVNKTLTPAQSAVGDPIENSIGMVLVPIPAGELMMGSPESEEGRSDRETQHRVTLTKPFYLGATEVTIGQFRQFVLAESYRTEAETDGGGGYGFNTATGRFEGPDPKYTWKNSGFAQTDDHPVVNVSWNDAQAFCKWLSAKEGVTYRLPTEAEWEYACRAGSTTMYQTGDDPEGLVSVGNVLDASAKAQLTEYPDLSYLSANDGYAFTAPVGRFRANPWGLYDLHGNVNEWCQDWDGEYPSGDVTDPVGPGAGSHRVDRGGSWDDFAGICRSAYRSRGSPSRRDSFLGFRVLRSSAKSSKQPISDPKPVAKTPDVSPPVEQPLPVAKPVGDPIENSIGMVLVPIPAGEFYMGSRLSAAEVAKRFERTVAAYFEDEHPRHRVTLTKSFHLGRTEVTQGQWKAVMGTTPWKGEALVKEDDDYPVTHVNWEDAVEFCRKLSEKEGVEYRLPTEAEWEYACRAGTTTAYSFGDDESQLGEYAWFDKNTGDAGEEYARIVGQKKPNPWGLYDMHGNVWEWCQDAEGEYPSGDVTDPMGPDSGSLRMGRGGGWDFDAWRCRSAFRSGLTPSSRFFILGFRVLRSSAK